jgi:hypothetical protein
MAQPTPLILRLLNELLDEILSYLVPQYQQIEWRPRFGLHPYQGMAVSNPNSPPRYIPYPTMSVSAACPALNAASKRTFWARNTFYSDNLRRLLPNLRPEVSDTIKSLRVEIDTGGVPPERFPAIPLLDAFRKLTTLELLTKRRLDLRDKALLMLPRTTFPAV